jgi:hypothetical protein
MNDLFPNSQPTYLSAVERQSIDQSGFVLAVLYVEMLGAASIVR